MGSSSENRTQHYIREREQLRRELKSCGKYVCYLCSKHLPLDDEGVDCHHLLGRDNDRIFDSEYMVFVHHQCHMQYHFSSEKPYWWHHFLIKLNRDHPNIKIRSKWQ